MNKGRMWKGLVVLCIAYLALALPFIESLSNLYTLQMLEGSMFAALLMFGLEDDNPRHWIVLIPLSAVANYLAIVFIPLLALLMGMFGMTGFNSDMQQILGLSLYASIMALFYCGILHLVLRPFFMTGNTYWWVSAACFMSFIPLLLPEMFKAWIFLLHKICWFSLFVAGLMISFRQYELRVEAYWNDAR